MGQLTFLSYPSLSQGSPVLQNPFCSPALASLLVDTPVVVGATSGPLCCFRSWAEQLLRGLWAAESQRWHFCADVANTWPVSLLILPKPIYKPCRPPTAPLLLPHLQQHAQSSRGAWPAPVVPVQLFTVPGRENTCSACFKPPT